MSASCAKASSPSSGEEPGDHRQPDGSEAAVAAAEYGFRLPSCIDNRPLRFAEWDAMRPQTTFVSATPARGR